MSGQNMNGTIVRLAVCIFTVILLTLALSITSVFADTNLFLRTGNVSLNLNDGKPIVSDTETFFAPGTSMEKTFTVENLSTCPVWYKFYFQNIDDPKFAENVRIEIRDGDTLLTDGYMTELTEESSVACTENLEVGERKELTILFFFDKESGNDAQGATLSFDFCAKAVQTKNNPDKKFD